MIENLTIQEAITLLQNNRASQKRLQDARDKLNILIVRYFLSACCITLDEYVDETNDEVNVFYTKNFPAWKIELKATLPKDKTIVKCMYSFTSCQEGYKPYVFEEDVLVESLQRFEENGKVGEYDFINALAFFDYLSRHPLRIWYREKTGCDYNLYEPSFFKILYKYIVNKFKNMVSSIMDNTFLNFIIYNVLPYCNYNDECIAYLYHQKGMIPPYSIQCKIPNDSPDEHTGNYEIFVDGWDSPKIIRRLKKLELKWCRKEQRRKSIAHVLRFTYETPLDKTVTFWRSKDLKTTKEEHNV